VALTTCDLFDRGLPRGKDWCYVIQAMAKRRILIADDSATTYHQLKKILDQHPDDFEVIGHAVDGADAVEKFEQLRPDLVTMDIVMPKVDGVEAVKQILKIDPKAKVVVVSSMGGVRDKVVAVLTAGAKNVIMKPFEADKVVQTLKML
jgi:two-component system, chemotaxis family, chemotaxis protein CheY